MQEIEYLIRIQRLIDKGLYFEAETQSRTILETLSRSVESNDPGLAILEAQLGLICSKLNKYAEAEQLSKTALKALQSRQKVIYKFNKGLNKHKPFLRYRYILDKAIAQTQDQLAVLYHKLGRYRESETLFREAQKSWTTIKSLISKKSSLHHLINGVEAAIAGTQQNLASLYGTQGKYASAEELNREALDTFMLLLGPDDPVTAVLQGNIANICRLHGQYNDAEELFQKAQKTLISQRGENHPETARLELNLGSTYVEQGKYEKAEELYLSVVKKWSKAFGTDSHEVALVQHNLAILYFRQFRYLEADTYYRFAIDSFTKALGVAA